MASRSRLKYASEPDWVHAKPDATITVMEWDDPLESRLEVSVAWDCDAFQRLGEASNGRVRLRSEWG